MRSTGEYTYFAADIAYHEDKRERGYDRVIDVWGADHHGYVARMQAAWQALGGDAERLELLIMQLVNLLERGQRAQMSKRQGEFVTLDDLIDDIGVDAARWFLLSRSHDTTLDLDLALAREQSQDNPVYYVQYAHARIASILRKLGEERVAAALAADLTLGRALGAAPVGAGAAEARAGVPGRGGRGRRAPRAAPADDLRARDRAPVLGLLPRLPRDRRGRRGRRRGLPDRAVAAGAVGDRAVAGPARGRARRSRCRRVASRRRSSSRGSPRHELVERSRDDPRRRSRSMKCSTWRLTATPGSPRLGAGRSAGRSSAGPSRPRSRSPTRCRCRPPGRRARRRAACTSRSPRRCGGRCRQRPTTAPPSDHGSTGSTTSRSGGDEVLARSSAGPPR